MTPEIAVERVRSFVRWRAVMFDALDDEAHEAPSDFVGWRRGQGDKRESGSTRVPGKSPAVMARGEDCERCEALADGKAKMKWTHAEAAANAVLGALLAQIMLALWGRPFAEAVGLNLTMIE